MGVVIKATRETKLHHKAGEGLPSGGRTRRGVKDAEVGGGWVRCVQCNSNDGVSVSSVKAII